MLRLLCTLLIGLLLAGCGFHLRGVEKLSPALSNLYIQTQNPNGEMIQKLERLLRANKIKITDSAEGASATLKIIDVSSKKQAIALIGGGQATRYTLTDTVTFSILDSDGKVIYGPTTVRASQNFSSNASQALTGENKTNDLRAELRENLANQILAQLTNVTLNKAKDEDSSS